MAVRKVWVVEELEVDGKIAHRETVTSYTENKDGSWSWDIPTDRLSAPGKKEWERLMNLLKDVKGEDLRHLVCGAGLMTHCLDPKSIDQYAG